MASWRELENQVPSLARLGNSLLIKYGRGFLATIRQDGSPRIQAICPVLVNDYLYAGIIIKTPKYADLIRDGRYVLHSMLGPGDAEFWIDGVASELSHDARASLMSSSPHWQMSTENAFFQLDIQNAYGTIFESGENNEPIPDRRIFRAVS